MALRRGNVGGPASTSKVSISTAQHSQSTKISLVSECATGAVFVRLLVVQTRACKKDLYAGSPGRWRPHNVL